MLRVILMACVLARVDAAPPVDVPAGEEAAAAAVRDQEPGDPNDSRLMFAPTGRPLRKGHGYFSDHELVFPGFAYGITDNVSIGGGVSAIPGLGFSEQFAYFSPKVGFRLSDRAAVSVGALVAAAGEDTDLGGLAVGFGVGTFGTRDHSVSVGLGAGRELGDRFAETAPVLMVGGQARLSRSVALVSENWLVLEGDTDLAEQPFGLALRFANDRLSADVGVILIGELLDEGYPIPWVSFTYHFGEGRPRGSVSARPTAWAGRSPRP